jgi:hypothetical protein
MQTYRAVAQIIKPAPAELPVTLRDLNDSHILRCAVGAKANAIITGDKDLLTLNEFANIPIVTPRDHGIKLKGRGGSGSMEYAKEVDYATGQALFHSGGFSVERGPERGVEGISGRSPRRAGAGGGVLAGVPVASPGGATGSQGPCAGDHPTAHVHRTA